jgi:ATP-dependent DNA ligase
VRKGDDGDLLLHDFDWSRARGQTFADRAPLFDAACGPGLEGVVAKRLSSRYRANQRGWIKTKNPNYWRRDSERKAMER